MTTDTQNKIKYTVRIDAKLKGAQGISSIFIAERIAETPEQARLMLYDDYEHIHMLTILREERGEDL